MALAQASPPPSPGPCEADGAIGSIVDRPGLGRASSASGSPCVVPPEHLLVESGFRYQWTQGLGLTSTLEVFPLAVARVGLGPRTEIVFQLPAQSNRGGAMIGGVFGPASGLQDSGFGFKRMLDDRPSYQDAVEVFYTAPTGTNGFSGGTASYTFEYAAAFPVSSTIGVSSAIDVTFSSQFTQYAPSLTVSYAFAPNWTLMLTDQITTPLSPAGGAGNRALITLQRVLSPGMLLDAEYEMNLLPLFPAARQHAVGFGAAFMF